MNIISNMQKQKDNFIILLIADSISSFGSNFTAIALVMFMFRTTNNLLVVSLFSMISILPKLIIAPFASKINLNLKFRNLFFTGEICLAIITANFIWINNIVGILANYALYVSVFFILEAYRAEFLKVITPDTMMYKRQSLSNFINIIITVIAPLAAGTLLSRYSIKIIFLIDIISYICSSIIILGINKSLTPLYVYTKKNTLVWNLKDIINLKINNNSHIYLGSIAITFIGGATSLLTLSYVFNYLGGNDVYYSLIIACLSLGSALGCLLINLPFIKNRLKNICSIATFLSGLLLFSVIFSPGFKLLIVILTISGILSSLSMNYYATQLYLNYKPEEIREKYTLFQIVIDTSTSFSKPVAGLVEKSFGVVLSLFFMSIIFIIVSPINFIHCKKETLLH